MILAAYRHGLRASEVCDLQWQQVQRLLEGLTMAVRDLLAEACAHLAGMTKLTRDEMRLASYPDDMPEIDVCKE